MKYQGALYSQQKDVNVRLTFQHSILGTAPTDPEIYESYIAQNAPDAKSLEEEIATLGVDAVTDKGKTVFHRDADGKPFIYDYMVRGFFKSACSAMRDLPKTHSAKLTSYKKRIDLLVMVSPRHIPIKGDYIIDNCQRPLRAQTMQGDRVALANSEEIPAGTQIEFTVHLLRGNQDYEMLLEWLNFGQYNGIGQWRNSGHGSFFFEILDPVTGKTLLHNLPEEMLHDDEIYTAEAAEETEKKTPGRRGRKPAAAAEPAEPAETEEAE